MSLVSITCPHCETPAQIQVTEVARSRECPSCGVALMLQVAERSGGAKRKALLVADAPSSAITEKTEDAFAQRHFGGEPFDRMRADPELTRAGQRLFYGVVGVSTLIVAVIAWNFWLSWSRGPEMPLEQVSSVQEIGGPVEPLQEKRSVLPPMLSRPMDFERIVKERQSALKAESASATLKWREPQE